MSGNLVKETRFVPTGNWDSVENPSVEASRVNHARRVSWVSPRRLGLHDSKRAAGFYSVGH